jgi:hypothetical protein
VAVRLNAQLRRLVWATRARRKEGTLTMVCTSLFKLTLPTRNIHNLLFTVRYFWELTTRVFGKSYSSHRPFHSFACIHLFRWSAVTVFHFAPFRPVWNTLSASSTTNLSQQNKIHRNAQDASRGLSASRSFAQPVNDYSAWRTNTLPHRAIPAKAIILPLTNAGASTAAIIQRCHISLARGRVIWPPSKSPSL